MNTVTLVFHFFSAWQVFKRSQHENYLSTNILKTHLCRLQLTMNFFLFLEDKCKHCGKFFNQLTDCREQKSHTGMKSYTCQYCAKSLSKLSYCKEHERTHTGEKPYTCKHCKKSFSQSSNCKRHKERHVRGSSLKQKQHGQCLKPRRDLQESAASLGGKKSCALSSLTEGNSGQVESLTCWICQKEFSSEACVTQHYDEHMRLK